VSRLHEAGAGLNRRRNRLRHHCVWQYSLNIRKALWCIFPLAIVAWAADEAPWQKKQIPDWTEEDAKDLLAESPWVKSFTPTTKQEQASSRRGGMGSLGGVGIGIPGMGGMGGRRGMGGGGYPGGGGGQSTRNEEAPKVTLRWESAMPVRTAELKIHDNDAPTLDDTHYAIAVYGIPDRYLSGDTRKLADQLKGKASIKRDGKKDFKPSSVEVLERPNGPVVVYTFPMTNEITKQDHRVEFDADIGQLQLTQSFFTDEMVWQGKLEL
jgi:hypothetical protein